MRVTKQLVAVVGPTGSGKTALAVTLAQKYGGVLISADSRQVYRGLNIGTNKEGTPGVWREHIGRVIDGVPQLLIDIVNPGDRFTLHDWLSAARSLLVEIWAEGQLPIVVGGTGLYVSALVEGYQLGSGRDAKNKQPVDFRSIILELTPSRQELYRKSDERFERVFDAVVGETDSLIKSGVSPDWLEQIGLDYRFASYYLSLTMNRALAIEQFQQASRQYIRRQLTWWRHHGPTSRITDSAEAIETVDNFLSKEKGANQ